MTDTPDFANPPIVELVLGAQFSPLTKLTAGHFGQFWKELGEDWTEPADAPLIEDQFELFERPKWSTPTALQLRLEPLRLPGRFMIGHRSKDRLLQIHRRAVGRLFQSQVFDEQTEALAVLGDVDAIDTRADDRRARRFQGAG